MTAIPPTSSGCRSGRCSPSASTRARFSLQAIRQRSPRTSMSISTTGARCFRCRRPERSPTSRARRRPNGEWSGCVVAIRLRSPPLQTRCTGIWRSHRTASASRWVDSAMSAMGVQRTRRLHLGHRPCHRGAHHVLARARRRTNLVTERARDHPRVGSRWGWVVPLASQRRRSFHAASHEWASVQAPI